MNVLTVDVEPDFPPHYDSFDGLEGLKRMVELLKSNYCKATFFVNANLITKYPSIVDLFKGFEVGCQGLEHVDYTLLSLEQVEQHLSQAVDIFKDNNIPVTGFRAPYGKTNENVLRIASKYFMYDSSKTLWNSSKYDVEEFPRFAGGMVFGLPPIIFNRIASIPFEDRIFYIKCWEMGGLSFQKIREKNLLPSVLGYSRKNYEKNLLSTLKQRTHPIIELLQ